MQAQNVKWLHMDFPANREKKLIIFYFIYAFRLEQIVWQKFGFLL